MADFFPVASQFDFQACSNELIAVLLERVDEVFCNNLRRSSFDLVSFYKMHQLAVLEKRD